MYFEIEMDYKKFESGKLTNKLEFKVRFNFSVIISVLFLISMWALFFFGFLFREKVTINEVSDPSMLTTSVVSLIVTIIFGIPISLLLCTKRYLRNGIMKSIE